MERPANQNLKSSECASFSTGIDVEIRFVVVIYFSRERAEPEFQAQIQLAKSLNWDLERERFCAKPNNATKCTLFSVPPLNTFTLPHAKIFQFKYISNCNKNKTKVGRARENYSCLPLTTTISHALIVLEV